MIRFQLTQPLVSIVSDTSRLDELLVERRLARSRSQAQDLIRRGKVKVSGKTATKVAQRATKTVSLEVLAQSYVSRGGEKLESLAADWKLDFTKKVVLDIGCSVGGFSDYVLRHGARLVIAVDVGKDQLAPNLRQSERLVWYDQTDIRQFSWPDLPAPDYILVDVSFISLRQILGHLRSLGTTRTQVIVLCKPQFEAQSKDLVAGIVKNSRRRREIWRDFETWVQANDWRLVAKRNANLTGKKGNLERFYALRIGSK